MEFLVEFLIGSAIAIALIVGAMRLAHVAVGRYRITRAGPRPLRSAAHVLWREPPHAGDLDVRSGPGGPDGAPAPPFRFIEEHHSGSQPCLSARDSRGRRWRVKWGQEVQAETFAVRFVWACGYFSEVTWFVPSGTIEDARDLQRVRNCVDDNGRFESARFELDDPAVVKMFEEHSWAWDDNPFVGTRQLNGLKILAMLLSNWDTKDRRDVARGSNTAIFEYRVSRWRREARYLITDWGGSMGRWGGNIVTRGRWDPAGFEAQTPQFVTGVQDRWVNFGYAGQRTADVAHGISVDDVRWLYKYLARLSDVQIGEALLASGATDEEAESFTRSLRARITQLSQI